MSDGWCEDCGTPTDRTLCDECVRKIKEQKESRLLQARYPYVPSDVPNTGKRCENCGEPTVLFLCWACAAYEVDLLERTGDADA